MGAPTGIQTPIQIYVRIRLALAKLARQIEIVDYVAPDLAAPLEDSLRDIERLLEDLGAAL